MISFRPSTVGRLAVGLGLLLALGASGCGSSAPTAMAGTVKLSGAPLPGGMIKIIPQAGSDTTPRSAIIEGNGHYYVPNLPAGEVKIAVEGPGKSSDPNAPPSTVVVPAKYASPDQSGLTFTVKEGANTHDIDLTP